MKIDKFENVEAWQLARELTQKVDALTKQPKFSKDHGLKSQIQNAPGSSMHNLAEGFDSESNTEFIRFLRYAKRSCTEAQNDLIVAIDENYITRQEVINYLRKCTQHKTNKHPDKYCESLNH